MLFFRELIPEGFRDSVIFLDLDGTIVSDGHEEVAPAEAQVLAELTAVSKVYMLSNKGHVRAPEIARRFGASAIVSVAKKPSRKIIAHTDLPDLPRVVIGDKYLTDGIFAERIGADFIKVKRLKNGHESVFIEFFSLFDDGVWAFVEAWRAFKEGSVWAYITLARPRRWLKNGLILTPLLFAGGTIGMDEITVGLLAVVVFSLAASSGYAINDIFDAPEDRKHPAKSRRPVASGKIGTTGAWVYAGFLVLATAYTLSFIPTLIPWIIGYLALTYTYSLFLKHIPVVEMIVVYLFYLTRVVAGGDVMGIAPSWWLLGIVLSSAVLVVSGKRYSESLRAVRRAVLTHYPRPFLTWLPFVGASATIILYVLYTIESPHASVMLFMSNIFVVFAVLWYLRMLFTEGVEDIERRLWTDMVLALSLMLWGFSFLLGTYTLI